MTLSKRLLSAISLLVLTLPASSWSAEAESSKSFFGDLPFAGIAETALRHLREAQQSILNDSRIKALLADGKRTLKLSRHISGQGIETTRFQDFYRNIEVLGSEALIHVGPAGAQVRNHMKRFALDVRPVVTAEQAIALARGASGERALEARPELKILPRSDEDSARLIYQVSLKGSDDGISEPGNDVLLDAHSGEVIAVISHWLPIAPVDVYQTNSECQEVDATGAPISIDIGRCYRTVTAGKAQPDADRSALQAKSNSERTLKYYQDHHGRDSFDGRGGRVMSLVHVGSKFANAFWDSSKSMMGYGDGDGKRTGDFTVAEDVAGHEMTHGVVSATSKLIYMDESGALNEAFADFFGKLISEDNDWVIGRKLFLDPAAKGLRSLANPGSMSITFKDEMTGQKVTKPYPAHVSERFTAKRACDRRYNDNCWVHVNSMIPGHAAYLTLEAIGREKAEKLFYVVMTQYLTATANFKAARNASIEACGELFDQGTCEGVEKAFAQVGL